MITNLSIKSLQTRFVKIINTIEALMMPNGNTHIHILRNETEMLSFQHHLLLHKFDDSWNVSRCSRNNQSFEVDRKGHQFLIKDIDSW